LWLSARFVCRVRVSPVSALAVCTNWGATAVRLLGMAFAGRRWEGFVAEGVVSDRIPLHRPDISEDEVEAVTAVLRSGWLTTGNECRQFEAEFARYVGARHAVALSSCTAALHLALEASGCQRGYCVLVPTLTFAATAAVVAY